MDRAFSPQPHTPPVLGLRPRLGYFGPLALAPRISAIVGHQFHSFEARTNDAPDGFEPRQERRSALISAAVTGKIDVRGLA